MKRIQLILELPIVLILVGFIAADKAPLIINADNVRQLQSVAHINYAELPDEAGFVDNGWFDVGTDAIHFAMLNHDNGIVLWDLETGYVRTSSPSCEAYDGQIGGFVDGSFQQDTPVFVAAYIIGQTSYVAYHTFNEVDVQNDTVCDLPGIPLHLWNSGTAYTWVELLPTDFNLKPYVVKFVSPFSTDLGQTNNSFVENLLSGPENDPDSFIRVGRIEPPLALTVTREGLLKRWNLETGTVTATAQVEQLPGAGQVNNDGHSLAWVDQQFEALHLLDFATGEDRVIAPLDGIYIPYLLFTPGADVIIGINVGLEPNVVAWIVDSGEKIDLGDYRTCNRQPDMVRLSLDGSTLVIGCDSGLDIWRIAEA